MLVAVNTAWQISCNFRFLRDSILYGSEKDKGKTWSWSWPELVHHLLNSIYRKVILSENLKLFHTITLTFSDVTTPGPGVVLSFNMRDEEGWEGDPSSGGEGLSSPGISYSAIANVVLTTDLLSGAPMVQCTHEDKRPSRDKYEISCAQKCFSDPLRTKPNVEETQRHSTFGFPSEPWSVQDFQCCYECVCVRALDSAILS